MAFEKTIVNINLDIKDLVLDKAISDIKCKFNPEFSILDVEEYNIIWNIEETGDVSKGTYKQEVVSAEVKFKL